jgi:hypothetical protein
MAALPSNFLPSPACGPQSLYSHYNSRLSLPRCRVLGGVAPGIVCTMLPCVSACVCGCLNFPPPPCLHHGCSGLRFRTAPVCGLHGGHLVWQPTVHGPRDPAIPALRRQGVCVYVRVTAPGGFMMGSVGPRGHDPRPQSGHLRPGLPQRRHGRGGTAAPATPPLTKDAYTRQGCGARGPRRPRPRPGL